jgi:lipopolysaccharide biosynthesis glycosyltransferase
VIHVAFALHDYLGSYSMYTGTAMASLFENTREPVTVHLLHNDALSPQNRERFIQLCASYGQNIGFYRVSAEQDFDIAAIEKRGYCEGIMFRLYLPRLLPAAVEKIIYLDSDLLINMDIRELFQKITTFFPDQDLLNVVFQDDVRYMDRKYNWFLIRNHNQPLGEKIYHYNAAVFNFPNQLLNFAGLYFDYWDKTPWRDAALGADHKMHLLIRMHSGLTYLQRKMDKGMVLTPPGGTGLRPGAAPGR